MPLMLCSFKYELQHRITVSMLCVKSHLQEFWHCEFVYHKLRLWDCAFLGVASCTYGVNYLLAGGRSKYPTYLILLEILGLLRLFGHPNCLGPRKSNYMIQQ